MSVAPTILGTAIGLFLFLVGLHQKRKLNASMTWPQVTGTIAKTEIAKNESGNSDDGYQTSYTPQFGARVVRYTFPVRLFHSLLHAGLSRRYPDRRSHPLHDGLKGSPPKHRGRPPAPLPCRLWWCGS